jgi:predicted nucleic acid-binding protein
MELFPFAPFAERVWALRENLTSYDAWYVALAEALDCPLATLDRKLSRAGRPICEIIAPPRSNR